MQIEDKYYSLDEFSRVFGIKKHTAWIMVGMCTVCKKSRKNCTCGEFTPILKAINLGTLSNQAKTGENDNWRIPHSEVEKRLKKYNPNL